MQLDHLSRGELADLVMEYLLLGQLIDRSGMPHAISAFGRDGMADVAIEEWMGASPIYTRRMQRALRYEGDGVETIFKGMQLDIGAPPQFMDFRYALASHDAGEFWLDHCGALMDVEPMGDDYVVAMCHTIEDPTFDATALATNPRAQVRPIHRPPRAPADRHPHCHWTVTIDESHPAVRPSPWTLDLLATRAASVELDPIDPADEGAADYAGPLLADLVFADWSASALRRIAEEVCLQGQLLSLSFLRAVGRRAGAEDTLDICRKQLTGIAGLAASRLRSLFDLGRDLDGLAAVLALHPALRPAAYVGATVTRSPDGVELVLPVASDAVVDGGWRSLIGPDHTEALDAIALGVSPDLGCLGAAETDGALIAHFGPTGAARPEPSEVALARFSTGADFAFEERSTRVEIRAEVRADRAAQASSERR